MALQTISEGPGFLFALEYTPNNGRVSAVYCNNQSTHQIWGQATLDNGNVFEQTFPVGETRITIPANVVKMTPSADGSFLYPAGLSSTQFQILYNS